MGARILHACDPHPRVPHHLLNIDLIALYFLSTSSKKMKLRVFLSQLATVLIFAVRTLCIRPPLVAFFRKTLSGGAMLTSSERFLAKSSHLCATSAIETFSSSQLSNASVDDPRMSNRSDKAPIVLVGFSGAGDEIMRLADTLVDQYYGAYKSTDIESEDSLIEIDTPDNSRFADDQKSSIIEIIGRDPEGIFTLRPNDMEQLLQEGAITSQDIIVVDFAHRLISEGDGANAPQLQARLLEALEFLYLEKRCLVIYVNIDAEIGLIPPIPTLMKDQIESKIIDLSDFEICIKDEGLHPNTVMAMQELGVGEQHETSGELTNTSSVSASTDTETSLEDKESYPEIEGHVKSVIERQLLAWSGIQFELLRIVARANLPPAIVGSEDVDKVMGPNTFFLSLSFDDVAKTEPYVGQMCQDVDAMELRVDLLANNQDRHHVLHQMQLLRRLCRPYATRAPVLPCRNKVIDDAIPIVYTVRTAHQAGTHEDNDDGIRRMFQLLKLGLRGAAEVLDVESAWDKEQTSELLDFAQTRYPSTMILGSHHVVGHEISVAEAVELFLNCGLDQRAHAAKVVLSIQHESQAYMAYDASLISSKTLESRGKKIIPNISLILGTIGEESRVVNPRFTPVTHECLPFKAAPGQLSASELMKRRVDAGLVKPKKYAILGHNISYSVSPEMQGAAFKATGLPHSYGRADVASVQEFIRGDLFRSSDFGGCSVTIPHKQDIIPFVDEMSNAAKEIGSVNTLVVLDPKGSERKIYGDNTDWIGIFNPLRRKLDGASDSLPSDDYRGVALIIGGGGTARAAAYAAKQLGLDILYYNRTPSKAIELASTFGGEVISSMLEDEKDGLASALSNGKRVLQVIISTLPKSADFELPEWVLSQQIKPIVLDVNYKPYNTPLLIQSQKFGCEIVRGSEMLWEQGTGQFELWTGRKAPYKVMKDVVLENCLPRDEQ